jgi:hypothetical protein
VQRAADRPFAVLDQGAAVFARGETLRLQDAIKDSLLMGRDFNRSSPSSKVDGRPVFSVWTLPLKSLLVRKPLRVRQLK